MCVAGWQLRLQLVLPCVAQLWLPGVGLVDSQQRERAEYKEVALSSSPLGQTTDTLLYRKKKGGRQFYSKKHDLNQQFTAT